MTRNSLVCAKHFMMTLAALLLFVPGANAGTIFDSGVTIGSNALITADKDGPQELALEVTFGADVTLRSLAFSGAYITTNTPTGLDDFSLKIYSDVLGVPSDSALADLSVSLTSRVDSGIDLTGGTTAIDIFDYAGSLAETALSSGTYWFALQNNTSDDTNDNWGWLADGGNTVSSLGRNAAFPNWTQLGFNLDLQLFDHVPAVPLPGGLPLLAAGLGLIGFTRRLQKS